MALLDLPRLIIGAIFLTWASFSDIKTRRVPNPVWAVMGILALAVLEAQMLLDRVRWEHHLILVPSAILFYDALWDRSSLSTRNPSLSLTISLLLYASAFATIAYPFLTFLQADEPNRSYFYGLLTIPAMILVAYGLYYVDLLKGGADAKALMAISILVPSYPSFDSLPIVKIGSTFGGAVTLLFPFALTVLLNTALLFIIAPLIFVVYNASRGDLAFPQALLGYRIDLANPPRFVWLMEGIEDGMHVKRLWPHRESDLLQEARLLREMGFERAWATPQVPFMLPLSVGFTLSFFIGNIIAGIFALIL